MIYVDAYGKIGSRIRICGFNMIQHGKIRNVEFQFLSQEKYVEDVDSA